MTDIAELLQNRWSPRDFDPNHEVSDQDVAALLEAARWAPSAMNKQPWRFIVGRRGDAVRARIEASVRGYSEWALKASVLVVNIFDNWKPETLWPIYDLGGTVMSMCVEAENLGLHARQFAYFDHAKLAAEFEIAEPFKAVTMTAIGVTPAGVKPSDRIRKGVDELLWPTS